MESATNGHHVQEQLLVSSSSSYSSSSSCYGLVGLTAPYSVTNVNGFHFYPDEEEMGFYWANPTQDLVQFPSKIKDEFSQVYYPKFTDLLNGSKGYPQILPNMNHEMGIVETRSSFDMNLEPLDRFAGSRFSCKNINHDSSSQIQSEEDRFPYGLNYIQTVNQAQLSSSSSDKVAVSNNGFGEGKRRSEPLKSTAENAQKKSRLETRPSCPPLKVRKEKLGDRIAALQHLVAPFGKTDTASVLMEAIGYIKFLHNQVETLSVPYIKASWHRKSSKEAAIKDEGDDNLKSRGMCLVPLSCLSYIGDATGSGGTMWPFGGGV